MIEQDLFLWAEKNSTEQQMNSENKNEQGINDTTRNTNINLTPNDWKSITDPKLRKKMRKKAYREANKEKIKAYRQANKHKRKGYDKIYREANKDKIRKREKAYYHNNKEKMRQKAKDYYQLNKKKNNEQNKIWRNANKEYLKNYDKNREPQRKENRKAYYKANKVKIREYYNNRLKTDIQYKLSINIRGRLNKALKNNYKCGSAVKDLGCSIDELKLYLESKFQEGMTWDNWTKDGWHIDHIRPLSSFDLTNREEFLQACHYTNLQPLWAKDNFAKKDKII
jgi:hypothetical protein